MSEPPHSPLNLDPDLTSKRSVLTMVRWLLYLAFIVIAFVVLRSLAPVLTPILAAAGLAYLLDPVVDWLVTYKIRRSLVVGMLLLAFIGSIAAAVVLLTPYMANDAASFIDELPGMLESSSGWLRDNFGYDLPTSMLAYFSSDEATAMLQEVAGPASSIVAAALDSFFGFLSTVAEILLVPVFAFYFLLDWDDILLRLRSMIPPRHRGNVIDIAGEIDTVVSSWLRGQFTVVAIQALLYAICFYFLDVRLAITVGLLVGLLTIIPFLGTIVGALITVGLVLLDWQGPGQLIGVVAVFGILHLLEAAVLTPRIVGKRVGLGEIGALFAVLAGGQLLGFAGVLLAVPIAASVAVLIRRLIRYYEDSAFFGAEDQDASLPAPPTPLPAVAAAVAISLDSAELPAEPSAEPALEFTTENADEDAGDSDGDNGDSDIRLGKSGSGVSTGGGAGDNAKE